MAGHGWKEHLRARHFANVHWRKTPNSNGHDVVNNGYADHYTDSHSDYRQSDSPSTVVTTGGWARPSRAGWATPPTSNIGTAMEYLKDGGSHLPKPKFTIAVPRREKGDSKPLMIGKNYPGIIDSGEAMRKYNGRIS